MLFKLTRKDAALEHRDSLSCQSRLAIYNRRFADAPAPPFAAQFAIDPAPIWLTMPYRKLAIALMILLSIGGCRSSTLPAPNSSTAQSSQPAATPAQPASPQSEAAIWTTLRQSTGAVVLLRHAIAPGTGDPTNFQLDDCSTQRNLPEAGREQARRIGATFRQRNIPIAGVYSSQWCRCLETARLLNLGTVEPLPALNSFFSDRSTAPQQTQQVQQVIATHRNTSGVLILVTHQVNITALTEIVPQQGEAIVLKTNAQNQVEIVGQLPLSS